MISSVNVTKSTVSCGFGHIYRRNSYWKTSFSVQWPQVLHTLCVARYTLLEKHRKFPSEKVMKAPRFF